MQIVLDRGRPQQKAIDIDERRFDSCGADINPDGLMFHQFSRRAPRALPPSTP
jgi:hypothetical protein